jgi:hypothetical protein
MEEFYGCPVLQKELQELRIIIIWPITLREEHRLGVFENRVLRRIFGPKRDEETGD